MRSGSGSHASSGSYPSNGSDGSGSYTPRSGGSSRSDSFLLQVAVICLQVHREVEVIRLEVAPCRRRSRAAVGLEVYLYRLPKRDMMSALHQTSPT